MQSESDTDKPRRGPHMSERQLETFIRQHVIPVMKEKDGSLTKGVIEKEFSDKIEAELGINVHTFYNRLYKTDLLEETGLVDYENDVEVWADALEEKHGRFRFDEFKKYLDEQTVNVYSPGHDRSRLFNELDEREGITYTLSSSNNNKPFTVFIKTKEKPFQEHREKVPDEEKAEEIFDYFLGKGCAPKTIVAGLRYVYKDIEDDGNVTYTSVAEEAGCSGVSVSQLEDKILDEFDLEVEE